MLCAFYVEHFGAALGARYDNPSKGFASRFLSFGPGARIEIMTTTALSSRNMAVDEKRKGFAHVAISIGDAASVDALAARLRACGVSMVDGPRRTGDGYYECVVLDPEGNRIELVA
jgi:lactoylglutathione lyase